ncbi:hypothetical protein [Halobacillus litoralis]|uniref:hypothetical protein n=1 Tax=Halobacillus litoralis TaxID=45668 RepID=UPI001CFDFCA1|nr:hypothetical protein [Halobacillus litoralis]
MKKWLIALGLSSALVVAGCSGDTDEGTDTENENQTEETNEDQGTDEQAVKKALLNAQMELTNTFKTYQGKITAYQTAVSAEEPDTEQIKSAGEEAKTAANEAATTAADYTVEADLPEETKTKLEEAVPSLQAYYEEVEAALNENLENADFSKADEKFQEFNDQFGQILEDAGFPATPNLMEEMS